MSRRSTTRRISRVLAVLAVAGTAFAVVPHAGATTYAFDYQTKCNSATVSLSISGGAGVLSLGGANFSHTYAAQALCSTNYTPGHYWEEPAANWQDPPIPHFDMPQGDLTDPVFKAYVDQLTYLHWQVRADFGDPSPEAWNGNLVETAADRVVAYLDSLNAGFRSVLPTHVQGNTYDRGWFVTWLNGGNVGWAGPTTLANGHTVNLDGTWHPSYHNFGVINLGPWAGELGVATSADAGVGAACASGATGSVTGYGTPGGSANLLGQEWRGAFAFGCGLLAGTTAGGGGGGGVFIAAGASVTVELGPVST